MCSVLHHHTCAAPDHPTTRVFKPSPCPGPIRPSPPSDPHPMAAEPAADDHDSRPPPADGPAVAGEGDASASAAADALMSAASEQLTLVYQGDVFVFDPVPPQKVAPFAPSRIPSPPSGSPRWSRDAALTCYGWSQFLLPLDDLRWQRIVPRFPFGQVQAVLLVLGGYEVPPGLVNMAVPTANDEKSTTVAARRVASLMRFREKRKERCFDKRIRYSVRKEVAQKYGQNSYY
ncbi:hypothetical protein HU200_047804 [Digitaria exilis]|uniref:Uncharacterized protein n=1 Tax=Digitaria exilis TaxID=1010633 RepID=A0A835EBF6_9POAL|nr:hypothetical protein HU200_047804 [Digitaria exilis]